MDFDTFLKKDAQKSLLRIAVALEMSNALHIAKEALEHGVIDEDRYKDVLSKCNDLIGDMATISL